MFINVATDSIETKKFISTNVHFKQLQASELNWSVP